MARAKEQAAKPPTPDKHGWYRVKDKTWRQSGSWSSRIYDPDTMVIVPGPASDGYGAALPPKPWRNTTDPDPDPAEPIGDNTTNAEGANA